MIMILTGKAKEDFSYRYNMSNFNEYSEVLQNALIIEWFDSVGIYILPQLWETTMKWNYRIYDNYMSDFYFSSRQEATEKAIIHANKIYNETKV